MTVLDDIRTKVRRLTGRPSSAQITDAQIDEYVNTFYQYDLPEELRLFKLRSNFSFMTIPNVAEYDTSTMLVDFDGGTETVDNVYYNFQPPVYIAGYQCFYSQSEEQFYRVYPRLSQIVTTITGDGTTGPYTFTAPNVPMLQNTVTIGAVDSSGDTIQIVDLPTDRTTGTWQVINTTTAIDGSLDYITGAGSITFNNAVPSGNEITLTYVPYQPNRPQALLYYADKFTLRPVPDNVYKVEIIAYTTPSQLLTSSPDPELKQWWQYLAYGAAKKIFEDTMDTDSVQRIMPAYKEQEMLVLRRALVQNTTERTATIYTEMTQFPYGNFMRQF